MPNFRELSKNGYTGDKTLENINCGSLQRIADAAEHMASNYVQMQRDLEWYKGRYYEKTEYINTLYRRIASLKGVITKLKKSNRKHPPASRIN